jgi:uncharacterized protein
MKTNSETDLSLIVRYWGAEWGGRKFDIYIDDEKLVDRRQYRTLEPIEVSEIEYSIP